MNQIEQRTLCDGVRFTSIRDTKFKTFRISVNFLLPLHAQTAAANALLPFLLTRCCRQYPDFTQMSRRLAALYGASLSAEVGKLGGAQVLTVSAGAIADSYALQGEHLTEELLGLLCAAIFYPMLEDGLFRSDDVRQEQRQTLEQIDAEYSDKRTYAFNRCLEIMCAGEPFGVNRFGSREAVQALTRESVTDAWRQMLHSAQVEVLVLGNVMPEPVAKAMTAAFAALDRRPQPIVQSAHFTRCGELPRVTDYQEVTQGKMVLGLRTSITQPDAPEQVPALQLMSAVFGGTPNSLLFLNVREKKSLCYYCGASCNTQLGLLFVQSGVEFDNMKEAEAAILEQLQAVQNGQFTEENFAAARLSMVNNLGGVEDSLSGMESWYLSQVLRPRIYTPKEYSTRVQAVTREQVVQAAATVHLDTVYCLKGKEAQAQ